jgi:hypothetical protein
MQTQGLALFFKIVMVFKILFSIPLAQVEIAFFYFQTPILNFVSPWRLLFLNSGATAHMNLIVIRLFVIVGVFINVNGNVYLFFSRLLCQFCLR